MRAVVVDTYYPAFLAEHYRARPGLEHRPYDAQLRSLLERSFGTSDAYSRGLRAAGHEAVDLIVNCLPLQRRWASEHSAGRFAGALAARAPQRLRDRASGRALRRILLAQLANLDPHVVYFQNLSVLPRRDLDALRRDGRLVVGQIASPAPRAEQLGRFDLILTSFPHFVDRFRGLGVDAAYFPIAFDAAVLDRLRAAGVDPRPEAARPHDVVFVGGVHPGVHGRGTALLEEACERLEVDIWGYGADALPPGSPIRRRYHGEAWGLDMYAVLSRAKMCLNRHIDAAEGHANNMRLYEATGVGTLLITDAKRNLAELFEPHEEVVTYSSEDELVEKIRHYLANDAERSKIARAGQERTLRDHTYAHRMRELVSILERFLP